MAADAIIVSGMAANRETRTDRIVVRIAPTDRAALVALVDAGKHRSVADAALAAIRRYVRRSVKSSAA